MRRHYRLDELCDIRSGGTPPRSSSANYGGNFPWAKIDDLNVESGVVSSTKEYITEIGLQSIRGRLFEPGTLLFAMYGSVGKMAWAGVRLATNQAILGISVLEPQKLAPSYLKHWLASKQADFDRDANGVTQKNLSAGYIRDLEIELPPIEEQQRIAAILDKADSLRRKRQEAIRLADQLLPAVFIEMFGSPDGPSKWPQASVADMVASIESGWSAPSSDLELTDHDLAVLKVSAVSTGWFLPNEAKAVDRSIVDRPLVLPRRGDLLFSRANTRELVAACCLVEENVEDRFLPDKLWRITAEPRHATNEYLCYLFRHPAFRHELTKQATGTSGSMLNISQAKLLGTSAPLPPIALQEKFSKIVKRSQVARRNSLLSLRDLESLKDSLTAELLN